MRGWLAGCHPNKVFLVCCLGRMLVGFNAGWLAYWMTGMLTDQLLLGSRADVEPSRKWRVMEVLVAQVHSKIS